jgi:hypothetical protein
MLLPAPPLFPRKRNRPNTRPTRRPPAPAALQVVAVENLNYDEPLLSFTLVFNTTAEDPLVAEPPLDPLNWSAVYQGVGFSSLDASVTGFDRVLVLVQVDAPAPGVDSVSYAAAPADVRDTGGRVLASFSDFPL